MFLQDKRLYVECDTRQIVLSVEGPTLTRLYLREEKTQNCDRGFRFIKKVCRVYEKLSKQHKIVKNVVSPIL